LYALANCKWLAIPWLPIAMVGTAVAFITGFKNSASYSRLWEARQIWGAIVNDSRIWGMLVTDTFGGDEATRKRLYYRHFAWLTALRYQLREPRSWENMQRAHNAEYRLRYRVEEWEGKVDAALAPLLSASDLARVLALKNRATHLIDLQMRDIRTFPLTELRLYELQHVLERLVESQGKAERIKNFPYPRQYATLNHFFIWMFIVLAPLGMLQEFQKIGAGFVWLTIPASTIVAWVFHTMDKIGEISENPFEGSPNDVPITAMSRTIEIDLREMLGEAEIPPALQPVNNILM
jgi:putative membrane protein